MLLQFTVKINFKNGGNILIGILEYGEKIPEVSFFPTITVPSSAQIFDRFMSCKLSCFSLVLMDWKLVS